MALLNDFFHSKLLKIDFQTQCHIFHNYKTFIRKSEGFLETLQFFQGDSPFLLMKDSFDRVFVEDFLAKKQFHCLRCPGALQIKTHSSGFTVQ